MKKSLLVIILLVLTIVVPVPTMAGVDISIGIGIPLPPPVIFTAPPSVIVIPDTNYVYAVPDTDADMFFWWGWWWRLWDGRWYRSHYYDRGWTYYAGVPSFYFDVDPGWRGYYRNHDWYGHRWNYQRIPAGQLQRNWGTWQNNRYWERHGNWGVQSYKPRPYQQRQELRHQRQQQYQQRHEVQRYQQPQRQHSQQPRGQQPQRYQQPQQQHSQQPRGQQRPGESQHQKSRGGPEHGISRPFFIICFRRYCDVRGDVTTYLAAKAKCPPPLDEPDPKNNKINKLCPWYSSCFVSYRLSKKMF